MTKLLRIFILSMSFLLSHQLITASPWLEGYWKSESPFAIIEIESTGAGIKVKRTDSNSWHRYDRVNDNLYKDQKGNSYYIYSDDRIEWRQRFGQRKISFQFQKSKSGARDRNRYDDYGNEDRYDDQYNDRDRRYERRDRGRRNGANYRYFRGLNIDGRWVKGRRGRRSIDIRMEGEVLKFRQRGKWRSFYYQGNGTFQDRTRDRIIVKSNNVVTFREWYGGLTTNYFKESGSSYCP